MRGFEPGASARSISSMGRSHATPCRSGGAGRLTTRPSTEASPWVRETTTVRAPIVITSPPARSSRRTSPNRPLRSAALTYSRPFATEIGSGCEPAEVRTVQTRRAGAGWAVAVAGGWAPATVTSSVAEAISRPGSQRRRRVTASIIRGESALEHYAGIQASEKCRNAECRNAGTQCLTPQCSEGPGPGPDGPVVLWSCAPVVLFRPLRGRRDWSGRRSSRSRSSPRRPAPASAAACGPCRRPGACPSGSPSPAAAWCCR